MLGNAARVWKEARGSGWVVRKTVRAGSLKDVESAKAKRIRYTRGLGSGGRRLEYGRDGKEMVIPFSLKHEGGFH